MIRTACDAFCHFREQHCMPTVSIEDFLLVSRISALQDLFVYSFSLDVISNNNYIAQTVFASYSDRAIHFMELPGDIPNR